MVAEAAASSAAAAARPLTGGLVLANGLPAGTITVVRRKIGVPSPTDANGMTLPAGVDPVCSIGPVAEADGAGTIVLSGSF